MDWWSEESLRQVAERAKASTLVGSDGSSQHGPWAESALKRAADALVCADWMRSMGVKQLRYVGPFGEHSLTVGARVVVRAGTRVYSTMPKVPKAGKLTLRAKVVRVARLSVGEVDREGGETVVRNPLVTWAGKGGYWCWCDANNVERAQGSVRKAPAVMARTLDR